MFANIRSTDRFRAAMAARNLLILPELPQEGAVRALDRLRAIIAELDWSAFSPGMRVTMSAGIATPGNRTKARNIFARADSALYAAKARRNLISGA